MHLELPIINNLDKQGHKHQPGGLITNFTKSNKIFESRQNLFKPTSGNFI